MSGRRSVYRFDWNDNATDRWLVRFDTWSRPLKVTKLPAGSDLLAAFLEEALAAHREGWVIGELTTAYGWFVARKPYPSREQIKAVLRTTPPA